MWICKQSSSTLVNCMWRQHETANKYDNKSNQKIFILPDLQMQCRTKQWTNTKSNKTTNKHNATLKRERERERERVVKNGQKLSSTMEEWIEKNVERRIAANPNRWMKKPIIRLNYLINMVLVLIYFIGFVVLVVVCESGVGSLRC
jgi:hypothetical protein